jgi:hypothetical protein
VSRREESDGGGFIAIPTWFKYKAIAVEVFLKQFLIGF